MRTVLNRLLVFRCTALKFPLLFDIELEVTFSSFFLLTSVSLVFMTFSKEKLNRAIRNEDSFDQDQGNRIGRFAATGNEIEIQRKF